MQKKDNVFMIESQKYWEAINADTLSVKDRNTFYNRKMAVDLYIEGLNLKIIEEQTGVRASETIRYTKKCFQLDQNERQFGYKALLPGMVCASKPGKLEKLFTAYPQLEEYVVGNYFADSRYTLERNMTVQTLHVKFLDECRRLGIQDYEYPFSTQRKGYVSLTQFIKHKKELLAEQTIKREGKDSQQKFNSTGFGSSNAIKPIAPYNIVQIDGHKIDLIYSVEVENEHGEKILMPATRMWLIAVIDVASRAVLGYSVTPNENYNQHDVLQAIYNSIVPHQRVPFTHSFTYPEKGGFPSEYCPSLEWATFDMIMMDNAKSHLAQNVVNKLTDQLKCTMNFGSVATPESRGIVERFFRTLEEGGFHRMRGTTGSHTRDPRRRNPDIESVKYQIKYEDILEMLEFFIAEYNNSAHSALENQTPLQVLSRRVEQAGLHPYVLTPVERIELEKLLYFTECRTIRGGYHTGTQPRISYMGVQYHAEETKIPMSYIGKPSYIEVNPKDLSHVTLFSEDGVYIATMIATGEWGRRVHTMKERELALKRRQKNKEENDIFSPPLTELEEEMRAAAKHSRRVRTQVATMKRQNSPIQEPEKKQENNRKKTKDVKSDRDGYSQEVLDALASMSIEEAYEKGLL